MDKTEAKVTYIPNCDLCAIDKISKKAVYDAKTKGGQWGYLCQHHYNKFGIGLGTGLGQRLVQKAGN